MKLSESLTDVCKELNNWFDRGRRYFGTFKIVSGNLTGFEDKLKQGQFYRVIGSDFNDGVRQFGDESDALTDETFDGAIWIMSVPPDVQRLAADIAAWRERYETTDSPALSPFAMESYTSFQVFGRTYPPQKARYSGKNESGSDFLPLWEAPLKASKI